MNRFPSKLNALNFLRSVKIPIGCVIDVGIQTSTPELMLAFPDLKHVLFEPVAQYEENIRKAYAGFDYELYRVAVSDNDGRLALRLDRADSSGKITHSQLVGPIPTENTVEIETVRLSTFLTRHSYPTPYLVKIDVDGHELAILRGLKGIEKDISCLVLEAPIVTIAERVASASALGFVLFDIVDLAYYRGVMWQVDLIFVSKVAIADNPRLRPMEQKPLDWSAWFNLSRTEPRP